MHAGLRMAGQLVGLPPEAGIEPVLARVEQELEERRRELQASHLEFQVRLPTNGAPTPVDPLDWLRSRQ